MPKGTYDPDRANRIAAAALKVATEQGVEGLSHRTVAAAAGVPLGSTSYYFKSLDGLIAAALTEARKRTDADLEDVSEKLAAGADLVSTMTDHLVDLTGPELSRVAVEYDLFLALLRRPALRPLSVEWSNAMLDMLSRHTDPETAQAMAYVFDGVLVQAIQRGGAGSAEDIAKYLRRALPHTD